MKTQKQFYRIRSKEFAMFMTKIFIFFCNFMNKLLRILFSVKLNLGHQQKNRLKMTFCRNQFIMMLLKKKKINIKKKI